MARIQRKRKGRTMTNKKRAKNEPTKGDQLAQQYRNRSAMFRVYEAATNQTNRIPYWQPFDIRKLGM